MRLSSSTIVTERLRLVPLVVDDAPEMVGVLDDEEMYAFTGGCPPSLDQLLDRYRRLTVGHSADGSEQWLNWIVRMEADDRAVGAMQATVATGSTSADVAWEIGVPWQGRGIASEAAVAVVAWLVRQGVRTITAYVHPEHLVSGRVAARAGLSATSEVVDGETLWRRTITE
jgi:RimJ/RimL family protein N-acetyltransferase